jgi:thiol-disulfide isomerase/thioredoxin/S1-C subfamily serine protease
MNASLLVLSLATVAAAPNDVLYDFYSTHCGPCQMMMPIVEGLQSQGLPVVKINIDERPDLMQRFGVDRVPTFVLIVGGREWQRVTGMQEESTLRAMLAQLPRAPRESHPARRSVPVRLADDENKKFDFHLPLPPFASKKTSANSGMVQIDAPNSGPGAPANSGTLLADGGDATGAGGRASTRAPSDAPLTTSDPDGSIVRGTAPRGAGESEAQPDPTVQPMLASSARIRVTDEGGIYFGSGVVIDGTAGKSIVLTCGHILRDVKPGSRIEVDLFEGKNFHSFAGKIVKFDLDADVGLVSLQTSSAVPASPVAGAEDKVARGQNVLSIGCSRGELPIIERLRVTMLNRYEGPDTIECTGVPVKGRSGGGLFTTNGRVVGVCTNADPQEGRGVYAGLKPILQLLRNAGLEELIPSGSRRARGRIVDVAAATVPPSTTPADDPSTKAELELAQLKLPHGKPPASETVAEEATTRNDAAAAALAAAGNEDAEVICIIRPHRAGNSKVVIINKASRKFMAYLTGEAKDQLQPTMGQTDAPPAAPASAVTEAANAPSSINTASTQTTSAWKPTSASAKLQAR